ncbi:MAG: hypothetical protein WBA07_33905 [Rivularia sp. (in: cyanobacteria)]
MKVTKKGAMSSIFSPIALNKPENIEIVNIEKNPDKPESKKEINIKKNNQRFCNPVLTPIKLAAIKIALVNFVD